MARFRATIQGNRGEASRLGHGHITTRTNGWNSGVRVQGSALATDHNSNVFVIWASGGSNGHRSDVCLGSVRETPEGRRFMLDPRIASKLGLDYMTDHEVMLDA